jgi:GDP-D-mannose dehydratase
MKKALITGITGQDGSYLTELLLAKGYESMASSVGPPLQYGQERPSYQDTHHQPKLK